MVWTDGVSRPDPAMERRDLGQTRRRHGSLLQLSQLALNSARDALRREQRHGFQPLRFEKRCDFFWSSAIAVIETTGLIVAKDALVQEMCHPIALSQPMAFRWQRNCTCKQCIPGHECRESHARGSKHTDQLSGC